MDEQAFPNYPVQQYSMPDAQGEVLRSDPNELAQFAKNSGLVIPADESTAMWRTVMDGRQGLHSGNATPEGIKEVGQRWQSDYGTDYSRTIGVGPYSVLIPTIIGGVLHATPEAINHWESTRTPQKPWGEHFGVFNNEADAEDYAGKFHQRTQYKLDGTKYQGPGESSMRRISDVVKKK